jgi:hypothetical protein
MITLFEEKWSKASVRVPSNLQVALQEAFQKAYLPAGKTRARTSEFLMRWQFELEIEPPADQTVKNVIDGKRTTCELWVLNGLCRLLLKCWYTEWLTQTTQLQPLETQLSIKAGCFCEREICPQKILFAIQSLRQILDELQELVSSSTILPDELKTSSNTNTMENAEF